MNSKERLINCIKHQPIDRVPITTYEMVGWDMQSFENNQPSYAKLMETIREKTDCVYMIYPKAEPPIKAEINSWTEGDSSFTKESYLNGELYSVKRVDKNINTTWNIRHLLQDIDDIDKYLKIPYTPQKIEMTDFYEAQAKLGGHGVMMLTVSDPIGDAAYLFEMSNFLVYAMTEPKKIIYFLDALHERQMHSLKEMLKGDVKDVIVRICGPEYATPPYLSPKYYHDYVTKYLITMCKVISEAGALPHIHSHGKIRHVLDEFALTEAVSIDPIEPIPDGDISLSEVKQKYGKKFCLFGNLELKELEYSSKERIDFLVKEAMDAAKQDGGFVLMPTAAPINIPLSDKTKENYLQMIESGLKYGKY